MDHEDQNDAPLEGDRDRTEIDEANADLENSTPDAPETTRDDRLDAGVPMQEGDPSEPQGPEDALGEGDKRGDYRDRQDGTRHLESRPTGKGGQPITRTDDDGNEVVVDFEPHSELVEQNPRVEQIGDVPGEKGGVTTA